MSLDDINQPGPQPWRRTEGLLAGTAVSAAAMAVVVAAYIASLSPQGSVEETRAPVDVRPTIAADGATFAAAHAAPTVGRLLTSVQAVDPEEMPPPAISSLTPAINDPVPDRYRKIQPGLAIDPLAAQPRPPLVALVSNRVATGPTVPLSSIAGEARAALSAMPTQSLVGAEAHDAVLALWRPPETVASPWLEWALRTSAPRPVIADPVPWTMPSASGLAVAPAFPDAAWQETLPGAPVEAATADLPPDAVAESMVAAAPALPVSRPAALALNLQMLTDIAPSAGRLEDAIAEVDVTAPLAPARIRWPVLANAPATPQPVDAAALDVEVATADPPAPLDAEPLPQDLAAAPVDPAQPAEPLGDTVPVGDGLDIRSAQDWVDPSIPWSLGETVSARPYAVFAEPIWPDMAAPAEPLPAAAEVNVIRAAAPSDDGAHRLAVAAPLTNLAVIDEAHGVRVLGPRRSDDDRQGYADARLPGCAPGDGGCASFVGTGWGDADAPLLTAELVADPALGLGQWRLPDDPFEAERALRCMVFAAYSEAGNQGALGMAAVVWVVVNRVAEQRFFENDPCSVVAQPGQFEPMSVRRFRDIATAIRDGALPPFPTPLNRWDAVNIRTARLVVWQLVAGSYVDDPSGGAYFFLAPAVMRDRGRPLPGWAATELRTASIGGHDFFRLPDRYQ